MEWDNKKITNVCFVTLFLFIIIIILYEFIFNYENVDWEGLTSTLEKIARIFE